MRLSKVKKTVEKVLRKYPQTRNSDFLLIAYTYKELGYVNENTLFFKAMDDSEKNKYISFESITRAKRSLKYEYPELFNEEVEKKRMEKQKEYIEEFARG